MLWMLAISLLLFWMPVLGPFIGGLVGGKKAGSVGRALAACFLPAFLFAAFVFLAAAIFGGVPLFGLLLGGVVGTTVAATILVEGFSMVCGAIVGGALA